MITLFVVQTVLPFSARCYSPRYLPIAANEPEVSPIGLLPRWRKRWITYIHVYYRMKVHVCVFQPVRPMYSRGAEGQMESEEEVLRLVCFSPVWGSTTNQVSCFLPDKIHNTINECVQGHGAFHRSLYEHAIRVSLSKTSISMTFY